MDKKREICLLNDSFPPTIDGVANTIYNYAQIIQKSGESVTVGVPYYPGVTDAYPFDVVRYPSFNTMKLFGYRAGNPFSMKSIEALAEKKFDIIHSHCPYVSTMLARTMREATCTPVILTYHTKFDVDIRRTLEMKLLQEATIKAIVGNISACDEVWVVSRGAGENLRSLGYAGDYIVMENGVDFTRGAASPERVEKLRREKGVGDEAVFLFVGRMMWYKGAGIILDGLKKAKDAGAKFSMFFVGAGGDADEIEARAKELGLTECRFIGAIYDREALRDFYSMADLFLFPSTYDTNGIVVREAAACGLASVLVSGSCAAEGITDGRNGILIEENADAMAACILNLCEKRGETARIGLAAMDEIYISWEDSVKAATARYDVVIERCRREGVNRAERVTDSLFRLLAESEAALEKVKNLRREEFFSDRFRKMMLSVKKLKRDAQQHVVGTRLRALHAVRRHFDRYQ